MGTLQDPAGRLVPLGHQHLVGRSRSMHLVIPSAEVSAQHLVLSWSGSGWSARDLGSRNGTLVDGRRLTPGVPEPIARGAVLELGGQGQRYTLVDDGPPAPYAVSGEAVAVGQDDLLAVPSPEEPVAVVMFDRELAWVLSLGETVTPIRDGAEVQIGGATWHIRLPEAVDPTAESRTVRASGEEISLRFRVSRDEEYVELHVTAGGTTHALTPRAHHYVLLTLARARLADQAMPDGERGWRYTSDLLRALRMSDNQLYVSLHRARREFSALGLDESTLLVERRPTTRQIRIAARQLKVEAA